MKGFVAILLRSVRSGEVVRRIEVTNLVVTTGFQALAKLVAGDSANQNYIDRMQFGTGGAAPIPADATLQVPINPIKAIATVSHPTTTSVRLDAYLASAEANGFSLAEAGLLTVGGTLLARTTFGAVTKTVDYQFEFQWTIQA